MIRKVFLRRVQDERGIALPMVLLIFFMSVALVAAFLVAIVGSSNVTAANKSMVQAQAAAEGGIAAFQVSMTEDTSSMCPASDEPVLNSSPKYTLEWTCALDSTPATVTVTSTGEATDGTELTIEAVFGVSVASATTTAPVALRTADEDGFTLPNNAHIHAVELPGQPANLFVEKGDFDCQNAGIIEGSVYVFEGGAEVGNNCKVWGDVYARDSVVVANSGEVGKPSESMGGDVVSMTGSVSVSGNGRIHGNVYALHHFTKQNSGLVAGNVHVGGNITMSGGGTSPWIGGNATHGGTFSSPAGNVGGTRTTGAAPSKAFPHPPTWQELTYDSIVAAGFKPHSWDESWSCTIQNWGTQPELDAIEAISTPTVIDARGCSQFHFEHWSRTVSLKTDIVIVSNSFHLRGFKLASADGNPHRIWFVVPSTKTTCSGVDILLDAVDFPEKKITSLAYSPCTIKMENSGARWHGSVYTNSLEGRPLMDYISVGLPGEDPIGGGSETGGTTGTISLSSTQPLIQRNVN